MDSKKIALIIFVILLPLLLVLSAYKMVFAFSSYNGGQQEVISFLEGKEDLNKSNLNITQDETAHLQDVKGLMKKAAMVFYFLLLANTLIFIFIYSHKDKKYLKKMFFYGGIATFALIVLLVIFSLVNFNFLFNIFHEIFFPQGNWAFSKESFLISAFPEVFFRFFIYKTVGLTAVLASLFIFGSFFFKDGKKKSEKNS